MKNRNIATIIKSYSRVAVFVLILAFGWMFLTISNFIKGKNSIAAGSDDGIFGSFGVQKAHADAPSDSKFFSTPFLAVYDGNKYTLENDFMFGRPKSYWCDYETGKKMYEDGRINPDLYKIIAPLKSFMGRILLQIQEIEVEESFLKWIELKRIVHPQHTEVIVDSEYKKFYVLPQKEFLSAINPPSSVVKAGQEVAKRVSNKNLMLDANVKEAGITFAGHDFVDVRFDALKKGEIPYLVVKSWFRDWMLGREEDWQGKEKKTLTSILGNPIIKKLATSLPFAVLFGLLFHNPKYSAFSFLFMGCSGDGDGPGGSGDGGGGGTAACAPGICGLSDTGPADPGTTAACAPGICGLSDTGPADPGTTAACAPGICGLSDTGPGDADDGGVTASGTVGPGPGGPGPGTMCACSFVYEYKDESGQFNHITISEPRAWHYNTEIIELPRESVLSDGSVNLRIHSSKKHTLGFLGIAQGVNELNVNDYREEKMILTEARHNRTGSGVFDSLTGKTGGFVHTIPGDTVDLEFEAPKTSLEENERETYLVRASGFYTSLRPESRKIAGNWREKISDEAKTRISSLQPLATYKENI